MGNKNSFTDMFLTPSTKHLGKRQSSTKKKKSKNRKRRTCVFTHLTFNNASKDAVTTTTCTVQISKSNLSVCCILKYQSINKLSVTKIITGKQTNVKKFLRPMNILEVKIQRKLNLTI